MIPKNGQTVAGVRHTLSSSSASEDEVLEDIQKRIGQENSAINAFLEVYHEPVRSVASTSGPLSGVPIAVKDNILVKGERVSAGSPILENYRAVYDATVVTRLKDAGAVLVGRTNMDEFAMGSSTEHSAYGLTKNPRALQRVAGGSSGGSAAAVAAGLVPAALGSDTGGSIRQPASFCGVVGLKPSYGAVSRYGLIAMGSSLDQIGPITRTVSDAEELFSVIRGHDLSDATTLPNKLWNKKEKSVTTIGVPWELVRSDGVSQEVVANMEESAAALAKLGYEVVDMSLPHISYSLAVYYIIMPAEASANLARFDGVRYGLFEEGSDLMEDYTKTRGKGFGSEVKRRIMLGTYVLSSGYYDAYYKTARLARQQIRRELDEAFESVDVIATPTTPSPAFRIGEKSSDPLEMYMSDIFTVPANVAGVPALSVPSGTVTHGSDELPLGLQLMAPVGSEGRLFEVGKKFLKEED